MMECEDLIGAASPSQGLAWKVGRGNSPADAPRKPLKTGRGMLAKYGPAPSFSERPEIMIEGEDNKNVIDIGRILRDDRDLVRHLPKNYRREESA